ncbi:zinc-finger-containing protein [Jiella avicenniae]|uniref:DUF3268 family zinc-finger domain-containing protein n=1 Tax=Jiella avicenniae TaxID=2907202 RepID=A0A9X1T546_9HYPH|nr:zinc-finger-containing protein [Jiella avicenniae]MCE7028449.1 DUF3268 family zinc-finger domain-containing protein [Jiella avicenniae]
MTSRSIWCCGCGAEVSACLTDGGEVYPHRRDLADLPFWKCDGCGNFVGCHHKTRKRTRPLGCIPTPEIKNARQHIHRLIDPLWKSGAMSRRGVYTAIADVLGIPEFHTAEIRSVEEARRVYAAAQSIAKEAA